jgi:hypothetical protein
VRVLATGYHEPVGAAGNEQLSDDGNQVMEVRCRRDAGRAANSTSTKRTTARRPNGKTPPRIKTHARTIHAKENAMAMLWVANVETETSDEEIKEFLCEYGFPQFDSIQRITGTGRRPAVVLGFNEVTTHALRHLQPRVHSMFWKERTLTVHVMAEHRVA